jgi:hypothetical protein
MGVVHRGRPHTGREPPPRGRRLLVLANAAAPSGGLLAAVRAQAADTATSRVLVVAPALNSRVRHWFSDSDRARTAAVRRLQACIVALARAGLSAEGMIGDADPLQALEDALRIFPADRLIVATLPQERSNWLARDVAERARRFGLPTTHLVVEPAVGTASGDTDGTVVAA